MPSSGMGSSNRSASSLDESAVLTGPSAPRVPARYSTVSAEKSAAASRLMSDSSFAGRERLGASGVVMRRKIFGRVFGVNGFQ